MEFQKRFLVAQSWWIASELVRRHAHLRILHWHPGGGQADALGVLDLAREEVALSLNRAEGGRLNVMKNAAFRGIDWEEVFSSSPMSIVERIERGAGLKSPEKSLPTEPHSLTYRILASVLLQMVNAKTDWNAWSAYVDTSGHGSGPAETVFSGYPTAEKQRIAVGRTAVLGDAAYGFWVLSRQGESVAVLDQWGLMHTRSDGPIDLMATYASAGRSLSATIGRTLGPILK
ncbi:TY-Chap2 family putative peptide chaperone [Arthrobacter sp. NPDC055138]